MKLFIFLFFFSACIFISSVSFGFDSETKKEISTNQFVISSPVNLKFSWIPGGSFIIGDHSGSGQNDEQPLKRINIEGFWIMTTEVTRSAYAEFVRQQSYSYEKGCWVHDGRWVKRKNLDWQNPGFVQEENHPVTCVSWNDVQAFIIWLNSQTDYKFRLPTEAEWEFATRAGSDTVYFFGQLPGKLCEFANAADVSSLQDYPNFSANDCDDGYVRTSPVAKFKPNPNGIYDVYGNVWEWVEDCWSSDYKTLSNDGSANLSGDCQRRGFRGGGYGDIPHFARSTLRNRGNKSHRKDYIGFRLVMEKN